MTNKFKVGDKVVLVEDLSEFGFPKDKVAEVVNVYAHGTIRIRSERGREETFFNSRLQLAESKPTKNERIAKLEEEVAELKLIVTQIVKTSTVEKSVPVGPTPVKEGF